MFDYSRMSKKIITDPARKRLSELAADRGEKSLRGLSELIGRDVGYLSDYITKNSPRKLAYEDAMKIADKLGIKPSELGVVQTVVQHNQQMVEGYTPGRVTLERGRTPPKTRDLPILGYVKAGEVGFFLDQGVVGGYAMRPSDLHDMPEAYAVRVHDDSMLDKLQPGWVLQIDPFKTPMKGDFVVVQLSDGQCFVKALVRRTQKAVIVEQFNPARTVEYKPEKVLALHLVVGIDLISR